MTRTKVGLLGFCAVILGLMAFNTSFASAEANATWLVLMSNGELLTGAQLNVIIDFSRDTGIIFHVNILGLAVLYECEEITAINTNLLKNGTVAREFNAEGKPVGSQIKFSGCITKLNGEINESCKPNAGGTESGVIKTNPEHGLIVLHASGTTTLLSVSPDTGETLAAIESTAECPVGKKVPIIGRITYKDCENSFLTHKIKHLLELGPLTEVWGISVTTGHIMTILGSWFAFLTGPHLNRPWSGHAG